WKISAPRCRAAWPCAASMSWKPHANGSRAPSPTETPERAHRCAAPQAHDSVQVLEHIALEGLQRLQRPLPHDLWPGGVDDQRAPDGDELELTPLHALEQFIEAGNGGAVRTAERSHELAIQGNRSHRDRGLASQPLCPP